MQHDVINNVNAKLHALQNQRNNALNECVELAAQLTHAHARIKELEGEVKKLTPVPVVEQQTNDKKRGSKKTAGKSESAEAATTQSH